MSRPRRPFGADVPGRLPATMLKVLAAEMSDPSRLARGKRYWADDAVVDLVVGHGALTAEVLGSRPDPYVVTIEARRGRGVPDRREVVVRCTCPDDDGSGRSACKHAVAALFSLADEVAVEPAVLARWRRSEGLDDEPAPSADAPSDDATTGGRVRGLVHDAAPPVGDPALEALLAAPAGVVLPELPRLDPVPDPAMRDRVVAAVLTDALAHLRVRWE